MGYSLLFEIVRYKNKIFLSIYSKSKRTIYISFDGTSPREVIVMALKRCISCPANKEYWSTKLIWSKGDRCIMAECRQKEQNTCAFCPIHMGVRSEYREKVAYGKRPKMIKCVEDDLVFASQKQAAEYYGVAQANLSQVLDKETRSLKGKRFVSWSCFKCGEAQKVHSDGA